MSDPTEERNNERAKSNKRGHKRTKSQRAVASITRSRSGGEYAPQKPAIFSKLLRGHRIEEDEEDEPSTTGAVALEENESSDQQSARQSLAAFFDRSPGVYTVREITEQTQINEMALRNYLKQLQKQELVASIRMGRSKLLLVACASVFT